ncbi:MAG: trehalose-phosphatase [Candidatus Eisenbacteria bacterium]|nr:trehalose-phosphatase [Candidatus Eisenbacteria bacterium]
MVVKVAGLAYPRHVSEEVDLLARALGSAAEVYLFLDYGGTLVSGAPGSDATPDEGVRAKLEQLGNEDSFSVFVLSGRTVGELDALLGVDNIGLIGQRGFEIRRAYSETEYPVDPELQGDIINHLELNAHRALDSFLGISIENRGFALTIRFGREVDKKKCREASQIFLRLVRELDTHGKIETLFGECTVEARIAGWHKGNAVSHILRGADMEDSLAIYIGDDVTDEDAFEAVREWADDDLQGEPWMMTGDSEDDEEPPHSLTILVAGHPRPSMASLFVRGPNEVYEFLSSLAAIASALM